MKKFMAVLTMLVCVNGCAVLNSGPKMVDATIEFQKVLATEMIGQIDFTQLTANAGANISDPRFSMRTVVGPAFVFDVTLALEGADLEANIAGAGVGKAARNVEGNPPPE